MITHKKINQLENTLLLSTELKGHQTDKRFIAGCNNGIRIFANAIRNIINKDIPLDINPESEAMQTDLTPVDPD